ncbi:hypothetical protein F5Y12DRAFT_736120 [Xylaria sp. FL1777]|nr:hypothetical protein F5Y12DRAFT_736120 [Xylaria sp. FL1777]
MPDGKFNIDVFLGGVYNILNKDQRRLMLHSFFFVNWDIDMFYFRCGFQTVMHEIFDECCLHRIKHIAVEIDGPEARGDTLNAPGYYKLLGKTTSEPLSFLQLYLPSVTTMYLALSFYTTRRMCAYVLFGTSEFSDGDVSMEDLGEELQETDLSLDYSDYELDSEMEDGCDEMLSHYPEDVYGFHHIIPGYHCYSSNPITYLSGRKTPETPQTEVETSFKDWVDQIVSYAEEDARNIFKHSIEIRMVMDHSGGYDRIVDGYYRGCVGLIPVDEPSPKS